MNLVDTPGTNVILQRQQRLTEEYVPRADLILFVLSSDRPLTDSEVRIVSVLLCLTFTYLIL
jgi:predicted GTPase